MTKRSRRVAAGMLSVLLALLSACAPQAQPAGPGGGAPAPAEQRPGRKTLAVAIQREPASFYPDISGGISSVAGGASNPKHLVHNSLAVEYDIGAFRPQLATELPSVEKGTWRINVDGTMDTVWNIRPNGKWHDGTPFTSGDLLFTFRVFKDPDHASTVAGRDLMVSASAPDAHTFAIHWKTTFVQADEGGIGPLMARHLLEEMYANDKASLPNSPLLNFQFVGLGPYRLVRWEQASHMEVARFDDYFLGRPAFDAITVRFLSDPNTMVANILAGAVDVVLPTGVDIEAALEVKRRWEGTGNQVTADPNGRLRQLEIQHRVEYARPRNGLTDWTVRQALYHAIDRQTLAEVASQGLAPVADSWFPPGHSLRTQLEASIPRFPYDPARARTLLAQAGWVPGALGAPLAGSGQALTHVPTGDRFDVEIWAQQGAGFDKDQNIAADGWKALGAQVNLHVIPAARINDREYSGTQPGALVTNFSGNVLYENRLHSSQITRPETRWSGKNRGGYSNPRVDALLDALNTTIDARQRLALHRDLLQEQMGDVALMPLYWEIDPILMIKGVKGPRVVRNESTWNILEWDRV